MSHRNPSGTPLPELKQEPETILLGVQAPGRPLGLRPYNALVLRFDTVGVAPLIAPLKKHLSFSAAGAS